MKNSKRLIVGALSVLLTSATFAQGEDHGKGHGPKGRPDRDEMRAKVLKKYDKDGDGKLSEEERAAARDGLKKHGDEFRAKMLKKYDKDGDGKLNEEERAAAREEFKKHRGEIGDKIMEKFDKDGNGELNKEEVKALLQALRKRHQDGQGGNEGKGPKGHSKGRGPGRRSAGEKSDGAPERK